MKVSTIDTPGLYVTPSGKICHNSIGKCNDNEVAQIAQLHGLPLPMFLRNEVAARGLTNQVNQLIEAEKYCENH